MSSYFGRPGIFLAWGLDNGENSGGDRTPEQFADLIAGAGFKWAAQEFGSPDGRPDPTADALTRFRARLHQLGINFGIWERSPRTLDHVHAQHPNFWILNVEDDYFDYAPLLALFRRDHPLLPAAVVTNCGLSARPFINHNVKAMPEAYGYVAGQDPNTTPANMVNRCRGMGWKVVFPTFGVFDDTPLSAYGSERHAGDGYSVYLAEGMHDPDWTIAKAWNA